MGKAELPKRFTAKIVSEAMEPLLYDKRSITTMKEHSPRFAQTLNFLRPHLDKKKKQHILDISSGPAYLTCLVQHFFPQHVVTATDREAGVKASKRFKAYDIEFIEGVEFSGMKPLPIESASYNRIMFTEVFEHLMCPPFHVLGELNRILKPKGLLYFTVPNVAHLWNRFKLLLGKQPNRWVEPGDKPRFHYGHFREWTMRELDELLVENGYEVQQKKFFNVVGLGGSVKRNPLLLVMYVPYLTMTALRPPMRSQCGLIAKKIAEIEEEE